MKYVMSWKRKRHGTQGEHEASERRAMALMRVWRRPEGVVIREFLARVGESGGFVVFETEDLSLVHQATAAFSGFNFHIDPVLDIDAALSARGLGIAWREAVE